MILKEQLRQQQEEIMLKAANFFLISNKDSSSCQLVTARNKPYDLNQFPMSVFQQWLTEKQICFYHPRAGCCNITVVNLTV